MMGGTGSRSEYEKHPDFMPDRYESGTPNTIGFCGLCAGISFLLEQTVEAVRKKEEELTGLFLKRLDQWNDCVIVYGADQAARQTALVSFNIKNVAPSNVALVSEEQEGILDRPGMQCASAAHRAIGSFPQGTIRFSFGFFNTRQDVEQADKAICRLLR